MRNSIKIEGLEKGETYRSRSDSKS